MYGSIFWWVVKLGQAVAIAGGGILLNVTGFDVALEGNQSAQTITYMRMFDAFVPCIASGFAIWAIATFSITEDKAYEIRQELEKRRGDAGPPPERECRFSCRQDNVGSVRSRRLKARHSTRPDAVAPGTLGRVERLVGSVYQRLYRIASRALRYAEADCHVSCASRLCIASPLIACARVRPLLPLREIGFLQHEQEFLATVATNFITGSCA